MLRKQLSHVCYRLTRSSGANSLSIWTRHFQHIKFDPAWQHPFANKTENVMIIGSGQSWGAALQSAAAVGRTVISGLSSHYGLAADQVLQATVVTTEGQILIVNDAQNQDLLWAIRGGGPGSYGIVLEYVLRTHPLPQNVVLGTLSMSINNNETSTNDSWAALASLWRSIPDLMDSGLTANGFAVTKNITPNAIQAADKAVELSLMFFGYNTTTANLKSLLDPVVAEMTGLIRRDTGSVSLSEPLVLPSYSALFDVLNPGPGRCGDISLTSSRLLGRRDLTDLPEDELRTYLQDIMEAQVEGRQARLIFGLQGGLGPRNVETEIRGALTPAWRNAYIHLISTGANVDFTGGATPQDALLDAAAWTEEHKEAVWRKWAPDSGSYINEANPFNINFQYDFYGGNYERLAEIKHKYDPSSSLYVLSGVGSHLWRYDLNSGTLCRRT